MTYHKVNRVLTESSIRIFFRGSQHVTFAAPRAEQLQRMSLIYLAPQPLHINLDQVGERIEVFLPYVFGDLGAADDLAGSSRQIFEERVLFRGQLDLTSATTDLARPRVNAEIGDRDGLRPQCGASPQQGSQPSKQFVEIERLGQVIVGADVKPHDAVLHRIARR